MKICDNKGTTHTLCFLFDESEIFLFFDNIKYVVCIEALEKVICDTCIPLVEKLERIANAVFMGEMSNTGFFMLCNA